MTCSDVARTSHWLVLWAAVCSLAFGQTAWKFEVASVKPAAGPSGFSATIDPGMVTLRNNNLRNLLMRAYQLRNYQVQGPGWIDSDRFDVFAKIPEGVPLDRVPAMLQDLLTARFQLVTRQETRQEDVFVLTVGRSGPKLTTSQREINAALGLAPYLMANELDASAERLSMPGVTLAMFANTLASLCGRPVLDERGIEGVFDISLNVPMPAIRETLGSPASGQASDPSNTLAAGIRELGLNWGARKAPIEHLVVESGVKVPVGN